MALPIFDRNRVARAVARGEAQAATLDLAAVTRRARGELQATRVAAERLRAAAQETRARLLEPARGARDAARAAFQSGALDVMRLVDAERVYTEAALVAIDLDVDAVATAIEARLAAGEDPLP
jgi:outer membrane protein TolC